jgi:hypothetical protein
MIGRGRFKCLSAKLDRAGIPRGPQAIAFSAELKRRTGCILTWNQQRRVFCVVRSRGDHMPLVSYMDIKVSDLPFTNTLLRQTVNTVEFYRARAAGDPVRMMKQAQALGKAMWQRERDDFVAERMPQFIKDMRRAHEILSDGRYRPKFFDTATKKRTTVQAA